MSTVMPMESSAEIFRHNVQILMKQQGKTQTDLANSLGLSRPGLSNLLKGKEGLGLDRAERIASALGFPLSALIAEKFNNPSNKTG